MNKMTKILYVDDEDYMLDCMAATFEIAELPIETASSGSNALLKMERSTSFHVIISDYRMPGMNGIDFLAKVAEIRPNTTRILCSAFMDGEDISPLINNGTIHHFIRKPWDINQLLQMVCSALESENSSEQESRDYVPKFMPNILNTANGN